jgi:16S rRNA (uracil1498-N3)-methyltransferase
LHLFYGTYHNKNILLNDAEAHHLSKVLRMKEGDSVLASAADGIIYNGKVLSISKKNAVIETLNAFKTDAEQTRLVLGVGILKTNDRLEWMLEKATELGVTDIHLLVTEHTERNKINPERLQKLILAACKQSLKASLPRLEGPQKFSVFLNEYPSIAQKFIAHCHQSNLPPLSGQVKSGKPTVLLIGPEGDFSAREVPEAEKAGSSSCGLGTERLRTETATIAALAVVKLC